jgi:hypothetical protein
MPALSHIDPRSAALLVMRRAWSVKKMRRICTATGKQA